MTAPLQGAATGGRRDERGSGTLSTVFGVGVFLILLMFCAHLLLNLWLMSSVDAVAHAALFAALTTLVECFGEESVARLVAELPEKISSGGYTLLRTLQ